MPSLPSTVAALLVATLLATSHPARANDPDQGPPDSLRIGTIPDEEMTRTDDFHPSPSSDEHRLIRTHPERILRTGSRLALKLDNGKFILLVDWLALTPTRDSPGQFSIWTNEAYDLEVYWPDMELYIVSAHSPGHREHWLISARTAKVTKLYAAAYRDPATPGFFITVGTHWMGASSAEVWEGAGENWVRQYKCDYLDLDAHFRRWDGPGRAILASPYPQYSSQEFLLTKIDGKWHTDACKDP